ncbi:MAG: GHMP kinase [Candidatus Thiodiazotropha sp. (ex Cardiolucina cf. quadrata)]|nr:GHMP kinase [Candidatus Thiodiazotropha sp. (ex Cardiolucina cf. quadrata)]
MIYRRDVGYPGLCIDVEAPARLHLGFLDLHGGLGRRFGSIGLTIDSLATRLRAEKAAAITAHGPGADRALKYAHSFIKARGIEGGVHLNMEQIIPDHVGLGSGTQMALAVGTAIEQLYGGDSGSTSIARTLQRGTRSGIGIGAFEQGGFILDCGRGEVEGVPPVAVRLPFPTKWRVLLLFDTRGQGLHGAKEVAAFSSLQEFPEQAAGRLCRLVMMQVLPGVLEERLQPVADAIGEIQQIVGDHFSPAQGGRFASPVISAALGWIKNQGFAGVGQSSWGPTGFVLVEDSAQAQWLEFGLKQHFGELSSFQCQQVSANNHGAHVNRLQAPIRLRQEKQAQ